MSSLMAVVVSLALIPISILMYGWAGAQIWEWFVVPIFEMRPLRIPEFLGLGALVSLMTYQYIKNESNENGPWVNIAIAAGWAIVRPLLAVFFAWVYLQFM